MTTRDARPAAVAEHQREQPHLALPVRILGKAHAERGEVHLRLLAGGGLEAMFENRRSLRPQRVDEVLERSQTPRLAALTNLAQQASC